MATWDHAQSAVALVDVGKLELADDHAAAHLVVGISVVLRAIKVAAGRAVEDQALGSLAAAEHEGRVVHFPAAAKERVEIGDELFVRQESAEGQAVGFFPFEHPREHAAPPALERVAAAGIVIAVFAALVFIGVKGLVERIDFGRGEEVGDLQEALEVEEEFLRVIHLIIRLRVVHRVVADFAPGRFNVKDVIGVVRDRKVMRATGQVAGAMPLEAGVD